MQVTVNDAQDCFITVGSAELLPTSLNGERYLAGGSRDRVHFQSSQFLVSLPNNTALFVHDHPIALTAPNTRAGSVMRVYVEPHDIDIDIELIDMTLNNGKGKSVATGANSIDGEETFTAHLEPGRQYIFMISFWLFGSIESCPSKHLLSIDLFFFFFSDPVVRSIQHGGRH